ncbi:MAG: hypothetical protein U5K43_06635 [Halofilum sp. (in: g-proteobacteria)]|nr:hypothetical protein [Halofilum sp. (in: g-proteobacteria)]
MAADDQVLALERGPFALEALEPLVAAAGHQDLPRDELVPGADLADQAGAVVEGDEALAEQDQLGELGAPTALGNQAHEPLDAALVRRDRRDRVGRAPAVRVEPAARRS